MPLTMTMPDGQNEEILLLRGENGFLETVIHADQLGIYAFTDADEQKRFVIMGEQNPPELRDILSTAEILKPISIATKGGVKWLEDNNTPSVRTLKNASRYAGSNWLALRSNKEFAVKSVESKPLLPAWAWLLILSGVILATWWREGRTR